MFFLNKIPRTFHVPVYSYSWYFTKTFDIAFLRSASVFTSISNIRFTHVLHRGACSVLLYKKSESVSNTIKIWWKEYFFSSCNRLSSMLKMDFRWNVKVAGKRKHGVWIGPLCCTMWVPVGMWVCFEKITQVVGLLSECWFVSYVLES